MLQTRIKRRVVSTIIVGLSLSNRPNQSSEATCPGWESLFDGLSKERISNVAWKPSFGGRWVERDL